MTMYTYYTTSRVFVDRSIQFIIAYIRGGGSIQSTVLSKPCYKNNGSTTLTLYSRSVLAAASTYLSRDTQF